MHRFCIAALSFALILPTCWAKPTPVSHAHGKFQGTLKLKPMDDGVHMSVLERFSYADLDGNSLEAAPGFQTDGASIPRALWTLIGSPFTGKYVKAAVVHDVGCVNHKYTWQTTHRMFYEAMIDSGVSEDYAKVLYFGVRLGGPRWTLETAEARSLEDLHQEVGSGTIIGQIEKKVTPGIAGGRTTYFARFYKPIPPKQLTDQDVLRFQDEVEQRRLSRLPITLTEIDGRTEKP